MNNAIRKLETFPEVRALIQKFTTSMSKKKPPRYLHRGAASDIPRPHETVLDPT